MMLRIFTNPAFKLHLRRVVTMLLLFCFLSSFDITKGEESDDVYFSSYVLCGPDCKLGKREPLGWT